MKKKYLIILIIFLVIIALISGIYFFLKKNNKNEYVPSLSEKYNFINANIETNCAIANNPELKTNPKILAPILNENYKKYGFPIEDNETMLFVLKKYEHDNEINSIIKSFSEKCKEGIATELYTEEKAENTETTIETSEDEKTLK